MKSCLFEFNQIDIRRVYYSIIEKFRDIKNNLTYVFFRQFCFLPSLSEIDLDKYSCIWSICDLVYLNSQNL